MYKSPTPCPPKPHPIYRFGVCPIDCLPLSFFQTHFGGVPSSTESGVLYLRLSDVVVCVGLGKFLFSLIARDMLLANFSWWLL